MNKILGWGGLGTLVAGLLTFGIIWNASSKIPHGFYYEPHVKVLVAGGHGSGTHIGNGYILTAGHVAEGAKEVTIQTSIGSILPADVLWSNSEKDVALLRLKAPSPSAVMRAARLDCAPTYVGQKVQVFGNPSWMERVYAKGEVIGAPILVSGTKVVPLDMTAAAGMSGGGVLNEQGHLVGVFVAGLPGGIAFTFAVPATVVCDLLARA